MNSFEWDFKCLTSELSTCQAENRALRDLIEALYKENDKKQLTIEELQVENLQLKMQLYANKGVFYE